MNALNNTLPESGEIELNTSQETVKRENYRFKLKKSSNSKKPSLKTIVTKSNFINPSNLQKLSQRNTSKNLKNKKFVGFSKNQSSRLPDKYHISKKQNNNRKESRYEMIQRNKVRSMTSIAHMNSPPRTGNNTVHHSRNNSKNSSIIVPRFHLRNPSSSPSQKSSMVEINRSGLLKLRLHSMKKQKDMKSNIRRRDTRLETKLKNPLVKTPFEFKSASKIRRQQILKKCRSINMFNKALKKPVKTNQMIIERLSSVSSTENEETTVKRTNRSKPTVQELKSHFKSIDSRAYSKIKEDNFGEGDSDTQKDTNGVKIDKNSGFSCTAKFISSKVKSKNKIFDVFVFLKQVGDKKPNSDKILSQYSTEILKGIIQFLKTTPEPSEKRILTALQISILYIQRKLTDQKYYDFFSTGLCITVMLVSKPKVYYTAIKLLFLPILRFILPMLDQILSSYSKRLETERTPI